MFDGEGKYLFHFGSNGKENGQFNLPYGISVDLRDDRIIVADSNNHRIQIFDEKGKFIRSFGSQGNGDGRLWHPFGVCADQEGRIYVADHSNNRVQVFDKEGRSVNFYFFYFYNPILAERGKRVDESQPGVEN